MRIKITSPIKTEEQNKIDEFWLGVDGVTYKSIDEALEAKAEDDKDITLEIKCPGGSVIEGYAIYDKLRSMEGCTVKAEVIGECSSMATVILLAASERKAYKDAHICIHKPRIEYYWAEVMTEDEALKLYNDLHSETERMLDIYVDRTGADREELAALMSEDKYITVDEAKDLGFVTEIIEHKTAHKQNQITATKTEKDMTDKSKKGFMARLKAMIEAEKEEEVVAMTLNTEDGGTIEVDREEGDPQVGDTARPDGEHKMADGKTIVIKDGVITEIREAESSDEDEENEKALKDAQDALKAANDRIAELEAQLEESKKAERSDADVEALKFVEECGGMEKLKKTVSGYKAPNRADEHNKDTQGDSLVSKMLDEIKNNKK